MAKLDIPLSQNEDDLKILFAWPNIPGDQESLADTIQYWFGWSLVRDGLNAEMLTVSVCDGTYTLHLDGPTEDENESYRIRFPGLLAIGWEAWDRIENVVKPNGKWDPAGTNEWRFFLTLGVGIANFRTLQLFHYPPARLLNPLRNSMKDPVTVRCRDLLEANGVLHDETDNTKNQTRLYETRINSAPIAAPDDQGTPQPPFKVKPDPVTGSYIPIEYFTEFQQHMIQLYLHPHPTVEGYTIPMIVYGRTPRMALAGQWMGPDCAAVLQILPQRTDVPSKVEVAPATVDITNYMRTPVLGSNHPYLFYAIAQIDKSKKWGVGCGRLVPENVKHCVTVMQDDLAVVHWQVEMAKDPSQNPWDVVNAGRAKWRDESNLLDVCALIWRQASLYYAPDDPLGNDFTFGITDWKKAREEIANSGLHPIEFLTTNANEAAHKADAEAP